MSDLLPIPPRALSKLEDWQATLAWDHAANATTWRLRSASGEVCFLKLVRRGPEPKLRAERDRTAWAAAYLPAPRVLDYGDDGDVEWLRTEGLPGVNAIDDGLRSDPRRLIPLLAEGLRQFHSLPVNDCPFDARLHVALPAVERRVADGLVALQELHAEHNVTSAGQALARLAQLRPEREDLVVCHGDYCLPNVLIDHGRVSGYVDLGALGVADRWADLAIATWSVTWNCGPGWEDDFLDSYGVQRDKDKIAFYRLLYDLAG